MSLPDRTSNSNSIALRPRTSLVRLQYGSYVCNTTISFSVRWQLRLISGRDGFSKKLSRFKILRGHLDQTRPNSSNNVRKQISIGCHYVHSVFTPFKPVRFELLGRTEDEYKCNRGIKNINNTNIERETQSPGKY